MSIATYFLIAIDACAIIEKYNHPSQDYTRPTTIDYNFFYIINNKNNVVNEQTGIKLDIKGKSDEFIRWRAVDLSSNFENTVILYNLVIDHGQKFISPPALETFPGSGTALDHNNILKSTSEKIENYYWSSEIINAGQVIYHFNFMIVDRNCGVIGYYTSASAD